MIPGLRHELAARRVLPESLLTFDARPECPTQIVRDTCDPLAPAERERADGR